MGRPTFSRSASVAIAASHGLTGNRSVSLTAAQKTVAPPSATAIASSATRSASEAFAASGAVIFRDRVPVHYVPPGFDVIGPAVLVLEVIGVFPDIQAKDWCVPVH